MDVKVSSLSSLKASAELTEIHLPSDSGVQNLRKAVYDFKLRAEAADIGSVKHGKIFHVACNYLYRFVSLSLSRSVSSLAC
jgi:hypothetical protein